MNEFIQSKVSVIVPVFNKEKYLDECIKSIVNQDYKNLEIILVDDGATDNSPLICEKWKKVDNRIKVFHKKNAGIGAARNTGLSMASGEYVVFVDADDWLEIDSISSLYKEAIKNNAEVVVGNFSAYEEDTAKFYFYVNDNEYYHKNYTPQQWFQEEYTSEHHFRNLFVVPWAKIYKRSLFENIYYPESNVEDDPTTWKIYLLANRITYINKKTYIHRYYNDSTAVLADRTKLYDTEPVINRIAFLKMLDFDTSNEEKEYIQRLQIAKEYALKEGKIYKYEDAVQKLKILKKYNKL